MLRSRRFRLPALIAGGAVIAASLITAVPASAAEAGGSSAVATNTVAASTAVASAAAAAKTVEYAGTFAALPDEPGGQKAGTLALFQVPGYGYLTIKSTGVSQVDALSTKVVTFAVRKDLKLSGSDHARFDKLAKDSVKHPLTVASIRTGLTLGKQTAALVNQTPVATATHRIYAVLVSPDNRAQAPNQTAAKVQTAVAHADDYWSQQSGGAVHFTLAGTTTWYKTSTTCKTVAGATALWNAAAGVAKTQLGYVAGRNNHLVLFFPSDTGHQDCGDSVGLGTIGSNVNDGGQSWVLGTDAPIEQGILAHELGHNLSLGHADWVNCGSTVNPNGGFFGFDGTNGGTGTGCTKWPYGDETDVMGFGQTGKDGGALSSPQAIRSGLWGPESAGAWTTVPSTGTAQTYNLQPVSGNSGLRAVVVQDDDGVNYFIEYRNFTGEDAQFAGSLGCQLKYCIAQNPGVRILRLENNAYKWVADTSYPKPNGLLGFPGDDSLLVSHYNGSTVANYTAGETFWSKGSSGVKIEVTAADANGATVAVTKNANEASSDVAYIYQTSTYDSEMRVGDTWTMMAGAKYDAQTTSFQWYRSPTTSTNAVEIIDANKIPGATSQNYKLQPADLGHYIRAVMIGTSSSGTPTFNVDPDDVSSNVHRTYGYGPITPGIYTADDPGSVSVDNSTSTLHAIAADYPAGTTFVYQWYSGTSAATVTTALTGQTTANHVLTAADGGKFLRVRVIATIPGYAGTYARLSTPINYSIVKNAGVPLLSGTRQIGTTITADTSAFAYTDANADPIAPTLTYQWLRNGVPITDTVDAQDGDYTLRSVDFGTQISFRVTATKAGYVPHVSTSAVAVANVKGVFGLGTNPSVAPTAAALTLSLTAAMADVSPAAERYTIQWYRGTAKITGETKTTYKLSTLDIGQDVTAKITYTRVGYNDLARDASPGAGNTNKWWLQDTSGVPHFTGNPAVGQQLTLDTHSYTNQHTGLGCAAGCLGVPTEQWLRNGKLITGTDASNNDGHYTPTAADKGAGIAVKITVWSTSFSYLLPSVGTSASTPPLGTSYFADWQDPATVTKSGYVLTAHSGVDDPTATSAYQWYRGTTAIAGQTHQTYTLADTDHDLPLWVRVTTSKTNYTPAVTLSPQVFYGIYGPTAVYNVKPQGGNLGDPLHVGDVVTTGTPPTANGTFTTHDGTPYVEGDLTRTYEWYRSGVRIPGLDPSLKDYTLQAADIGKTISVKIRVHANGTVDYVNLSKTQDAAQKVLAGVMDVSGIHPEVDVSAANLATVTMVGTATPSGYTLSYKWLRSGATLTGQTKSSYSLTSANTGKLVQVIVTMTKTGYNPVVFPRVDANRIRLGTSTLTSTLDTTTRQATLSISAVITPGPFTKTWAWYRDGKAISGALGSTYTLLSTDTNKTIQAAVKVVRSGYETYIYPAVFVNGFTSSADASVSGPSGGVYTCNPSTYTRADGAVVNPGTNATLAYQWLRNGALISGAASANYAAQPADSGASLTCRITVSATLHKAFVDNSAAPVTVP